MPYQYKTEANKTILLANARLSQAFKDGDITEEQLQLLVSTLTSCLAGFCDKHCQMIQEAGFYPKHDGLAAVMRRFGDLSNSIVASVRRDFEGVSEKLLLKFDLLRQLRFKNEGVYKSFFGLPEDEDVSEKLMTITKAILTQHIDAIRLEVLQYNFPKKDKRLSKQSKPRSLHARGNLGKGNRQLDPGAVRHAKGQMLMSPPRHSNSEGKKTVSPKALTAHP